MEKAVSSFFRSSNYILDFSKSRRVGSSSSASKFGLTRRKEEGKKEEKKGKGREKCFCGKSSNHFAGNATRFNQDFPGRKKKGGQWPSTMFFSCSFEVTDTGNGGGKEKGRKKGTRSLRENYSSPVSAGKKERGESAISVSDLVHLWLEMGGGEGGGKKEEKKHE